MHKLAVSDVQAAQQRIAGRVRPVAVAPADTGAAEAHSGTGLWLALEYMQYTGSFKARGAINFISAHRDAGLLPSAGVTIASGGNAGLACAWAAQQEGVHATVFLPASAPTVKVSKLRDFGAEVRLVQGEYADALAACQKFSAETGALASHAFDHPLIAAGAGTILEEIRAHVPDLSTVIVAVGGGGLFAGIATAGQRHGIRTVAVEPENCCALHAAVQAGQLVDVSLNSVASDSLGARRASNMALAAAQHDLSTSLLVSDHELIQARQALWDDRRIAVEHGTAAAWAALLNSAASAHDPGRNHAYIPSPGEQVAVILCGGNTDPSDLVRAASPGA